MMRKLYCMCFVLDTHLWTNELDERWIHSTVVSLSRERRREERGGELEREREDESIGYSFNGQWQRHERIINISDECVCVKYHRLHLFLDSHAPVWMDGCLHSF